MNNNKMRFVRPQPKRIFETFIKVNGVMKTVTIVSENPIAARRALEKMYGADSIVSGIKAIG